MSTDFFQRQSNARRNTIWLIVMFLLATTLIVMAIFFAVAYATQMVSAGTALATPLNSATDDRGSHPSWQYGGIAAFVGAALILLGTLYKVFALRSGGGVGVAESVGGKRVYPNTELFAERKLLNIVEEMAIASGMPVPPVFVLEESGINAFAAGYSPDDAVIGVTRGAMEHLNREQLQGVIAHEFSHILNGDMRMNIRMIGILHGILLIALAGRMILRMAFYEGGGRRSGGKGRGEGAVAIFAAAAFMLLVGSIGSVIGGLIKAAVSRQREYLADSSAVQFTRNPQGIAGALKKIGGNQSHGLLKHHNASEASHMYFARGVFEGFTGLMATHPPLRKRILAIVPEWDGIFPEVKSVPPSGLQHEVDGSSGFAGGSDTAPAVAPTEVVSRAADQIGAPQEYHRRYAAELIEELDADILHAVREPYLVRGLIFALLLDRDEQIRASQLTAMRTIIDEHLLGETIRLAKKTRRLPDRAYLPLVDMALPALAAMSHPQYGAFSSAFSKLAAADAKISLFEWTLGQVLRRHLRPRYERVASPVTHYYGLQQLGDELSVLLSTLARVGHSSDAEVRGAFDSGSRQLQSDVRLLPPESCTLNRLDAAVVKLRRASARLRGLIVDACASVICTDGKVHVREAELLRGIADILHCPVPPLIERP